MNLKQQQKIDKLPQTTKKAINKCNSCSPEALASGKGFIKNKTYELIMQGRMEAERKKQLAMRSNRNVS